MIDARTLVDCLFCFTEGCIPHCHRIVTELSPKCHQVATIVSPKSNQDVSHNDIKYRHKYIGEVRYETV